jgi:uncharacterized protein YbaP (TraB family)
MGPDGAVVYLLGTVHIARRAAVLDPAIERAFAASESLVLEVRPGELDPQVVAANLVEVGTLPEGKELPDVISRETWTLLEKRLADDPIPVEGIVMFEPWVVALMLQGGQYQAMGFTQEQGMEFQMVRRAKARGMRISGLETAQDQLQLFDALDYPTQELLLLEVLKSPEEGRRQLAALLAAWERGDLDEIERFIAISFADNPAGDAFLEATIFERNRNMARTIGTLLKRVRRVPPGIGRAETRTPDVPETSAAPATGAP